MYSAMHFTINVLTRRNRFDHCVKLVSGLIKNCTSPNNQRVSCFPCIRVSFLSTSNRPKWGSKKLKERLLDKFRKTMSEESEIILAPFRARVKEQGDLVRSLKENKATEMDVLAAVSELKHRKKILEEKELELAAKNHKGPAFDRLKLEDLLKQRFFYDQSFGIYGGVQGLYDYGPMGCAVKQNLLQYWRSHFVLEEQMLEVDCSMLTPEPVLKASGHVDRFADFMCKDSVTGDCFRADHLIEANLEALIANKKTPDNVKKEAEDLLPKIDNMRGKEMEEVIQKFGMKSSAGNLLTPPVEFNLMFQTSIGPVGNVRGYLRPETAQGIFVNFERLYNFNQNRLPFAAAQIGNSFRNEISPRSGIIRVREFTMAEIEHFCDPTDKSHPKFDSVRDIEVMLYSACNQMDGKPAEKWKFGDAVDKKLINNQTLGYFLARVFLFMTRVGVDPQRFRFRQHMSNEMAHYASDCWDAECLTSYGWVECVGCADRSCFDLTQHSKATGARLNAQRKLAQAKQVNVVEITPNKGAIAKKFKADVGKIVKQLASMSVQEIDDLDGKMNGNPSVKIKVSEDGSEYELDKDMLSVKRQLKTVQVEDFVPGVIEPSFGIGRIMYAVFEHNFRVREGDEARTYLTLPPLIAPYKCSVLPLSNNKEFAPFVKQISEELTRNDLSHKIDDSSGSIGRRYARTDQLGIPFAITIDFDTVKQNPPTVTMRDLICMEQVRLPLDDVAVVMKGLSTGRTLWADVRSKYPSFVQQETTD